MGPKLMQSAQAQQLLMVISINRWQRELPQWSGGPDTLAVTGGPGYESRLRNNSFLSLSELYPF